MKLGLIIKITNGGEQEAYAINRNETWVRFASDARSLIKELTNFDGTGKSVHFLKFIGQLGYFICVVKARPAGSGRDWDNTAAWIYVPANVDISGKEEESVIRIVENAISGEKEIDKLSLENEFSKDFVEKDVLFTPICGITSQSDGSVAARFYGRGTDYILTEFLGNSVGHPDYKKYRAIFLLDKGQGISMSNNNILNIKSRLEICYVKPPVCKGFTPYLPRNVVFNKPIEVYVGQSLTITWARHGFKAVQKSCTVSPDDNGNTLSSLLISPMEYIRIIPVSTIQITDTHYEKVSGCELRINGKLVNGEYIEIPDASYEDYCDIKVTKQGYSPYSEKVNFAREKQISVTLRPQKHFYEFSIPCYNGKEHIGDAILTLESEHHIQKSPVEGYSLMDERVNEGEGSNNRLKKSMWEPIKHFCYGFLSCIIILLLYAGWTALDDYEFSFGWPPFKTVKRSQCTPSVVENDNQNNVDIQNKNTNSDEKAIAYLNGATTWNKDSLNQYPLLDGLFDDLNEMNLEKLSQEWKDKLKSVVNFSKIASNASMAIDNNWNVKQGKHAPTYNTPEDKLINVLGYIDWLSKDQTPATTTHSSGNNISGKSNVPNGSKNASSSSTTPAGTTNHKNKKGDLR